jgi:uncharacterized protein (DUF488 family)
LVIIPSLPYWEVVALSFATRHHGLVAKRGAVYSVGYEGFTLDGFTQCMIQNHVDLVVDVRLNAVSRKPGFSKKGLAAALDSVGVAYLHEPKLGNPPENRDSFRTGDVQLGRKRIQRRLNNGSHDALCSVAELARHRRIAVLCVERDHQRCHRSVITDALVGLEPQLEVIRVI